MAIPNYDHIVVVVEENHDYNEIIGNPDASFINNTLVPDGALMTNFSALTHPSEPNYFGLYAGSTFGVTDDGDYSEPDPTIGTILQYAGMSFVGFVEDGSPQKHNPWESFPEGTSVEQSFSAFPTSDFSSLPTVSFVIPNLNDDMHDGTIQQGDQWLQQNLGAYEQWAKDNNSLLVTTWDENDGTNDGNHIATIFDGAGVAQGTFSDPENHYNLLATIASAEGVTGPRNAATASPITSAFSASAPPPPPTTSPPPEPPPPAPPPPPPTPGEVTLTPGMDVQALIDANPNGTVFQFAPGTFTDLDLTPKDGDYFLGSAGTILDGQNETEHAFSGTASGVTIDHLAIRNYTAPAQDAPVHGDESEGWIVKNNEISYNAGGGVDLGDRMQVLNNYIHHNLQIGVDANNITPANGRDIIVSGNEIAFNNYTHAYDPGWEAGGAKFWATTNLQVTHNYVHDNVGPGLWSDTDNIGTLYDSNVVENNTGTGIQHEVSYDATITNNLVANNNSENQPIYGWPTSGGIEIGVSGGSDQTGGSIEIHGNMVLSGQGDGIAFIAQDRSTDSASYGPHVVQRVHVYDNTVDISASTGGVGGSQDIGDDSVFTSMGNYFDNNTYYLGNNTQAFNWMDVTGDVSLWQGFGQDTSGTFYRSAISDSIVDAFRSSIT